MFIGHWAPALLAAAAAPRAPRLGTLFVAAQLVDWAFMGFLLVDVEHMRMTPGITAMNALDLYHMPFTHSLVGSGVFALLFGLFLWWWRRDVILASIGALVVVSHWFIDWLVHRPDLTIDGAAPFVGLGLWNVPAIAIPLELLLTVGAFALYVRSTKGPIAPAYILLLVLLALQAFNWLAPEPEQYSIAFPLMAFVGFGIPTLLAVWVGSTRWHKREHGLAVATVRR